MLKLLWKIVPLKLCQLAEKEAGRQRRFLISAEREKKNLQKFLNGIIQEF